MLSNAAVPQKSAVEARRSASIASASAAATVVPPVARAAATAANGDADVLAGLDSESFMTTLDLIATFDKPNPATLEADTFRMCVAAAPKSGKT